MCFVDSFTCFSFLFSYIYSKVGGGTGPHSCKLESISPERGVMEGLQLSWKRRGWSFRKWDQFVLLLKVTWKGEAPPPLPLPPIQPSRAAAPVSYYKMAAQAPPPTRNP